MSFKGSKHEESKNAIRYKMEMSARLMVWSHWGSIDLLYASIWILFYCQRLSTAWWKSTLGGFNTQLCSLRGTESKAGQNTPLLDMVKSFYLFETLYGIRVSHSVTMDQYIHSVSFELSTNCHRSRDGHLGVCDLKPMRINDGSPEIAANWLQQPKKRKQTGQKWEAFSGLQFSQTDWTNNPKLCRKGKWTLSHTRFYNSLCFKNDRIRSEDEWCIPGEIEEYYFVLFRFMTHIDTLTNKKYSGCNSKHSEKDIPSFWTVNKYKEHFILQEQTCWAKVVLGSMLCLTETINTAWFTFPENIRPHILLPTV